MRLIAELERLAAAETSLFRAQLLREDIARLAKLRELAQRAPDAEAFRKAGMRIGWTPGDTRTRELAEPLAALLDAVYAAEKSGDAQAEDRVVAAWNEFNRFRIERLVGCLSPPVPKPAD
ncbi:MAG: hypothetical protein N2653_08605 [Burkholderiales bacterium]|nr:hypothetical protein [Burkholderiales bacterium]